MPRKVFTAGEILTAANLNDVSDQSVMVFDDATARATAIPTPVEGMVTYLKDTDRLEQFDGTNFVVAAPPQTGVLQVVSSSITNVFSTASTTYVDVTGLSASITPSAASSKIIIISDVKASPIAAAQNSVFSQISGGNSGVYIGDADSSRTRATSGSQDHNGTTHAIARSVTQIGFTFLDSPATASAITYKVQIRSGGGSTVFVNRSGDDGNNAISGRFASSITVMEVAG